MVGMFVCDQDRINILGRSAQPLQPPYGFLERESKVHENAGIVIFNQRAITTTATAQGCDAH